MSEIERLLETRKLKTSRLKAAMDKDHIRWMDYDPRSDILMLMIVPPTQETVVHYIDEYVALLYEPDTNEVVGFQVEAFEHSFMPEHAPLAAVWRLSDTGVELDDVRDLLFVFEGKKRDVARELTSITNDLLSERGEPVLA